MFSRFTTAVTLEELTLDELETAEELAIDEELSTLELEPGPFFVAGSFDAELVAVALEFACVFAAVSLTAELVAAALELVSVMTGALTVAGPLAAGRTALDRESSSIGVAATRRSRCGKWGQRSSW